MGKALHFRIGKPRLIFAKVVEKLFAFEITQSLSKNSLEENFETVNFAHQS